jgi:ketosteroid isomerase-like protein
MSKQDDAALAYVSVAGELPEDEGLGPLTRELRRVEAVNDAFYDALRARDIEAMSRVWLPSPHVRCVHPRWELVVGWIDIRESWAELFASLEHVDVQLEDVHVEVAGRVAWVNLLAYTTLHTEEGDIISASSIATNVFEIAEGEWKMVLHHSSSFLEDDLDDDEDPLDLDPERPPRGGSGMDGAN